MIRRNVLKLGALAAAGGILSPTALSKNAEQPAGFTSRVVKFTTDGLDFSPAEYASVLQELSAGRGIKVDNYSLGGVVAELEQQFAQLLGKESAVFMPTGTLANHIAVRRLAGERKRVFLQAESHLYNDSGDCAEVLSGLNVIPLAPGETTFTLDEVQQWVRRTSGGRVETGVGVISIESPVRRKFHTMFDYDEMKKICEYARGQGIKLHLDGARLFNVPYHSGRTLTDYTNLFDTVYVSLWKCFNSGSGAMLAGSKSFIEGLFHVRRMFGGGLPQAWQFAAIATKYADGYLEEYAKAWKTADKFCTLLGAHSAFKVEKIPNGTSIFKLSVQNVNTDLFVSRLLSREVVLPHPQKNSGDFWMTVNTTLNRREPSELATTFIEALNG
ncbi:MAG: beta-eliminating lyase-related protein [Bacteroidota bacterium]